MSQAERAALEALEHPESLAEFVGRIAPRYARVPRHLQRVYDVFEASRHRPIYARISMPPRHGKTISIALGLAYRILYDPACLNFYSTFGDSLSQLTSRKIRKLVREAGVPLSPEAQGVQHWETIHGGGLVATSVGGGVTGKGCNGGVFVCDDMIKSRKEAESQLHRDTAWDYLRDDAMSRLEVGASLIVNATRWHEDDLIGRLKNDPLGLDWLDIEMSAVSDADGNPVDERDHAAPIALWPEGGYDLEWARITRLVGEHRWWSLYQQRPFPKGGLMFDRSWFKPIDRAGTGGRVVRGWDLAASTERDSAATAGVKLRLVDGKVIIEDVVWLQGTSHQVEDLIVNTARQDGNGVTQSIPQDPGQAGKAQIAWLGQKLHGYTVHFSTETGSKESRADPFAAQAQAGNVMILAGAWNDAYLSELESFPVGRLRDRVDASTRAYAWLLMTPQRETHGGYSGTVDSGAPATKPAASWMSGS